MRWKLLGAAVIALGGIIFSLQWRNEIRKSDSQEVTGFGQLETTAFASDTAFTPQETLQYKSKIRTHHRKPSQKETIDLIRNTNIPVVNFEDIPLREVLDELNRMTAEAGVSPDRLQFKPGGPEIFPERMQQMRIRELKVRNMPLSSLLTCIIDSSFLRCRIGSGVVTFYDARLAPDLSEQPSSSESPDPFAP